MKIFNVKSIESGNENNSQRTAVTTITLENGNEIILPSGDHKIKILTGDVRNGAWEIYGVEIECHVN